MSDETPQTGSPSDRGWNLAQRIGFGFVFAYMAVYILLCRFIQSALNIAAGVGFAAGGAYGGGGAADCIFCAEAGAVRAWANIRRETATLVLFTMQAIWTRL